jgi:glycyl-tRNA synthetase
MVDMDKIVSLCKRRGFIFQSSEIYGGLGSAWDYGPLGVELKNNVKRLWWRDNVHLRDDMVGLDAAITMHPKVWEASGHLASFSDPFTGCADCGRHYRADQIVGAIWNSRWFRAFNKMLEGPAARKDPQKTIQNWIQGEGKKLAPNFPQSKAGEGIRLPLEGANDPRFLELLRMIASTSNSNVMGFLCPNCGSGRLSTPKPAGLMLETLLGPVQETATKTYLRPETAQGIFVNFDNILQSMRKKLPFGVAQIGKAFRNEITPGNFTFRTREFEQMEIEFFVMPGTDEDWHQKWIDDRFSWYQKYGIRKENIRLREHISVDTLSLKDGSKLEGSFSKEHGGYRFQDRFIPIEEVEQFEANELAHYAKRCVDIEYLFPMGWSELEGIANRTDYDLRQHSKVSGKNLDYFDEEKKLRVIPYVIEPSAGADRSVLAFLVDAYSEEEVRGEKRVVLNFHQEIAPVKIAVLPLLKKNDRIVETATKLTADLRKRWYTVYDDTASIGRLYRRQDEVGTPFCVTVDVQTVGDDKSSADEKVTIRDRNSMEQVRVALTALPAVMEKLMAGQWADVYGEYGITKD